jgi:ketosteroid isomerase-like protein
MKTKIPSAQPLSSTIKLTTEQEQNVHLATRFVKEILGGSNWMAFDELVAPDVRVSTGLKPDGLIEGRDEYKAVFGEIFGSGKFKEATLNLLAVVPTADNRIIAIFEAQATHVGELWGISATGRRIGMTEIHVLTFRDGKLVENLVGACNPLDFEMLFAPAIAKRILK